MTLVLTSHERAMLDGSGTEAERIAMSIIVRVADVMGAEQLLEIGGAHIDSCLYHGRAGLDFAERLVAGGGRVQVPTTLNVSSLDLLHPELYRGDAETAALARRLMECYEKMGARPTWTCAPYQLDARPAFGGHVAWAESNAIVFANSVLGARTHRYGDFIDICAAITGRVPAAGLHLDEGRGATLWIDVAGVPGALLEADVFYPVFGHLLGKLAGVGIPAVTGLPAGVSEDRLKAVGAAAASSGAVALMHIVGSTPEAPTLADAYAGAVPSAPDITVTMDHLRAARDELTTASGPVGVVSIGTPHYSVAELETVARLLDGRTVATGIDLYISTGRNVMAAAADAVGRIEQSGASIVVDTCTYITPIIRRPESAVMTDSGKWAFYAPGNLGIDVVFGSMAECIETAVTGEVVRDDTIWG